MRRSAWSQTEDADGAAHNETRAQTVAQGFDLLGSSRGSYYLNLASSDPSCSARPKASSTLVHWWQRSLSPSNVLGRLLPREYSLVCVSIRSQISHRRHSLFPWQAWLDSCPIATTMGYKQVMAHRLRFLPEYNYSASYYILDTDLVTGL